MYTYDAGRPQVAFFKQCDIDGINRAATLVLQLIVNERFGIFPLSA